MRGIGIRLGILGAIVVGGLIARPFLTDSAGDLHVGDCFDVPSGGQETVKDVQHHPCDQEHSAEVIFVGDFGGSSGDTYPTDVEMLTFLSGSCLPAYHGYTGTDVTLQATYDIAWLQPTTDGWDGGDRSVICYLYRLDGTTFRGSLKAG